MSTWWKDVFKLGSIAIFLILIFLINAVSAYSPNTPSLYAPSDEATVSTLTPTFSWSIFSDQYPSNYQTAYQLRVLEAPGPNSLGTIIVLDKEYSGTASSVTPSENDYIYELENGKWYHWHVKVKNNRGEWSDWAANSLLTYMDFKVILPLKPISATISLSGISSSYSVGSTINANVYVMNNEGTSHTFPVGFSLKDPLGKWIDLPPKTITLYPDTGGYVYFTYDIPTVSTTGIWTARTAVYDHDAGSGNLQIRYDYKEQTFNVITITPTKTPTPAATPPEPTSSAVLLHGEKTEVVLGEDVLLKLSAVNLIANPPMNVQVILYPPSGMSVTSSEFVKSGAGIYTTTYSLAPSEGKDIEVRIKTNQVGDFNVKGRIVYYFGDNKSSVEDHTLNLPIKVRKEVAPAQNEGTPAQKQTPGFDVITGVSGLLLSILLIRAISKLCLKN